METEYDFKNDIYNIIYNNLKVEYKNYKKLVDKIKFEIYSTNTFYANKDYGNILKEDKIVKLKSELEKYQYLSGLENFYKRRISQIRRLRNQSRPLFGLVRPSF